MFQRNFNVAFRRISLSQLSASSPTPQFYRSTKYHTKLWKNNNLFQSHTAIYPCVQTLTGKRHRHYSENTTQYGTCLFSTETQQLSRPLGPLETLYHIYHLNGTDIFTMLVCVDTRKPVTPVMVKQALQRLVFKYPLLRMRIQNTGTEKHPSYLFSPMVTNEIHFRQSENFNCEEVMLEDSLKPFNYEQGPLWRITLLNDTYTASKNLRHKIGIALTCHHGIADGSHCVQLLKECIDYIHYFQTGGLTSQHTHQTPIISAPFEHFPLTEPRKATEQNMRGTREDVNSNALRIYEENFRPEITDLSKRDLVVGFTRSKLIKSDSDALMRDIKDNQVSLTSSCIAAACLSFCKILEPSIPNDIDNFLIPVNVMVDLRRYITDINTRMYPGCAVIHVPLNVSVPVKSLGDKSSQLFWELARKCFNDLRDILTSGIPIEVMKSECAEILKVESVPEGKSSYVVQVSSLINMEDIVRPSLNEDFQVTALQNMTNITINEMPVFFVMITTLHGEIYLELYHCKGYTSTETAASYSNFVHEMLSDQKFKT